MSNNTNAIEFTPNKALRVWALIASLAIVGISIRLMMHTPQPGDPFFARHGLLVGIGLAGVAFFGAGAIVIVTMLFDKSPALIISDEGVTDNSTAVSAGFIPWADVVTINDREKYINLVVKNPQQYIDKQPNFIKRKVMQINQNAFDGAIAISTNGLKYEQKEIVMLLEQRLHRSNN